MDELVRSFMIFSFAVIAFSQYLRTIAQREIEDAKDRLERFEQWAASKGEMKRKQVVENKQYEEVRSQLLQECKVPSDTGWYYLTFLYLAFVLLWSSVEKLFNYWNDGSSTWIEKLRMHGDAISGIYVLVGLVLLSMVFRAGFRAIAPKNQAHRIADDIALMESVERGRTYTDE